MGEIGDPCGSQQFIALSAPTSPSRRMQTVRSVAKDPIQLQRLGGQSCSRRRFTSLSERTVSKALLISSVAIDAVIPVAGAVSTSWVRQVVKFTEDLRGSAPNCWVASTLYVIAIHDMRLEMTLSSPFPSTERSAMGRYDRGLSTLR